jgi:hypothetical protein
VESLWIMEHLRLLVGIVGALIATIAGIAWNDLLRVRNDLRVTKEKHAADVERLEREMNTLRINYLDRFADLRQVVTDGFKDVVKQMETVQVDQSRDFVRRSECPYLHKRENE